MLPKYSLIRESSYEEDLINLGLDAMAIDALEEAIDFLLSRNPRESHADKDYYVFTTEIYAIRQGPPDVSIVYRVVDAENLVILIGIYPYTPSV